MIVILTGKSGSGKDRIIGELKEKYNYYPIISYTSRPKRENETNGVEYNFITKEEFISMINSNQFIEYRTYNTLVNNKPDVWYYGVKKINNSYNTYCNEECTCFINSDLFIFNIYTIILDLQGTKKFIKYYGKENCKVIYIDCDDKIREERAKARGSFDQIEWNRRLKDDNEKFSEEKLSEIIDYRILNNGDFEQTIREVLCAINEVQDIEKFIRRKGIDKIFLDVDGVVLHSCEAMAKILNRIYNKNVSGEDILSWNFKEISNDIIEPELEYLFTTDEFFDKVEFIDGVLDFIKRHEDNIVFVTKGKWQNFIGKEKLFEKYKIGNIPMIGLPMNVNKDIINMSLYDSKRSLFIDDNTKNLNMSNAKYKIQFREYNDDKNREWQNDWHGKIMYHW